MKKIITLFCILLTIFSLSSCGESKTKLSEKNTDNFEWADKNSKLDGKNQQEDEFIDIGMSVYDKDKNIIDSYRDDALAYKGEPFELYVRIENYADFPVTVCLSALIKSSMQPFVIAESNKEVMSSTVVLNGKETHEFHMYVDPVIAYTDQDALIQYMLYTTKGIEKVKAGDSFASSFATMSQIAIKAENKANEKYPPKSKYAIAKKEEQFDLNEKILGFSTRLNDEWIDSPKEIDTLKKQQLYVCASGGGNEQAYNDVTKYMILTYMDGELINGFDGQFQAVFNKKEKVLSYFPIDNDVLSKGEHLVSTVLIPIEYENKDEKDKGKLLAQSRYWIVMGNEDVFTFK